MTCRLVTVFKRLQCGQPCMVPVLEVPLASKQPLGHFMPVGISGQELAKSDTIA